MSYSLLLTVDEIKHLYLDEGGHGMDHVLRVHRTALWIAERVGADLEIVNAAALLHDIARRKEGNGECHCHAEEGSRQAGQILNALGFDQKKVEKVCHCIAVHRYSKAKEPQTLEAKVLQDADRLDALGAICVARVFMYNGLHQMPMYEPDLNPVEGYSGQRTTAINHFYEKILKLTPETFHTGPAKRVARRRYHFIEQFLHSFLNEWYGHDLIEEGDRKE